MHSVHERREAHTILDVRIDACSYESVNDAIARWTRAQESRYVCIANVHVVTTAWRDARFAADLAGADLVTPDGFPIAWAMRRLGRRSQRRVDGPGWMLHWCERAAADGIPMFLYGSTDATLELLRERLTERFPDLRIVGMHAPPFRPLEPAERTAVIEQIRGSGAAVVLVGLGAPRQESWMADMRGELPAVMVGVGAAFDFHAGLVSRAPGWMQRSGLEWVHRLASEPRRLWRRYLVGNSIFVAGFSAQLLRRAVSRA